MEQKPIKSVTQVRIEFDDNSWEIIDHQNLRHISKEVRNRLDFALFELETELQRAREEAEKKQPGLDLGIDVIEDINTKDIGPGQKG